MIIYFSTVGKMIFPLEKRFSIKYIYRVGACELINKVLRVLNREEVT
jgi:hypothetical protein